MALLTNEAYSHSVSAPELMVTIVLFCAVYLLLFVAWIRLVKGYVQAGPDTVGFMDDDANALPVFINRLTGEEVATATAAGAGPARPVAVGASVAEGLAEEKGGE